MANEVKGSVNITIGANADALNQALETAQKKANSFTANLAKAAALGATAFLSLKEGVLGTVMEFAAADAAAKKLDQALLNQGIYSKALSREYNNLAESLGDLTGAAEGDIQPMLASAQAMLGTTQITSDLTNAVADLAAGMGLELGSAFELVSKSIGSNLNALGRYGIAIDTSMSKQEKMAAVIEQINAKYSGQAVASQNVGTAITRLGSQFGNLREDIGARFAPVVEKVTKLLLDLVMFMRNNPGLLDFVSGVALAGTALLGMVSGVLAVKAAFVALAPVFAVVTGPIGIIAAGLIAAAGAAIYLARNFDQVKIAFNAFATQLGVMGMDLGNVLAGIFTFDLGKIQSGLAGLKQAFSTGYARMEEDLKAHKENQDKIEEEKNAERNAKARQSALKREQDELAHTKRLEQIEANKTAVLTLQSQIGSKELIDLKNRQNGILTQLDAEYGEGEVGRNYERINALKAQLAQNHAEQLEAEIRQKERLAELDATFEAAKAEAKALQFQTDMEFTQAQNEQLYNMALSQKDAERQVGFEVAQQKIEQNNQMLKDRAQFGETYAKINQALNSREVQGAKQAADELVGLTQSKNATLKAIGKAAAVTQIGIDTAQGAASVFAKLNAIFPILAPGIGAVAAAATLAFGAERTAQVLAANKGGIVPGSGPNVDSQLAMLTPGELVVPRQNFDEVVGSVKSGREGGGSAEVVDAINGLSARLESRPNVVIQGDMLTDDVFIDRLIQKISDRLEFGNARLVGVNA